MLTKLAWKLVKDEKGGDAWSNLQDALRLGDRPRCVLTTTPRPTNLVLDTFLGARDKHGRRKITPEQIRTNAWEFTLEPESPTGAPVIHRTIVRRWSTERNAANLAPGYAARRRMKYSGTRLGLQELDAEFLLASDSALPEM